MTAGAGRRTGEPRVALAAEVAQVQGEVGRAVLVSRVEECLSFARDVGFRRGTQFAGGRRTLIGGMMDG